MASRQTALTLLLRLSLLLMLRSPSELLTPTCRPATSSHIPEYSARRRFVIGRGRGRCRLTGDTQRSASASVKSTSGAHVEAIIHVKV